jgi:hypothetical protein
MCALTRVGGAEVTVSSRFALVTGVVVNNRYCDTCCPGLPLVLSVAGRLV